MSIAHKILIVPSRVIKSKSTLERVTVKLIRHRGYLGSIQTNMDAQRMVHAVASRSQKMSTLNSLPACP
jgi:hypothetical protein